MRLVPAGPEDFLVLARGAAVAGALAPPGGLEPPEVLALLARWAARVQAAQGWSHWLAIEAGEIVVSLGVKAPIRAGAVELGFATAPARRGRGLATQAVGALLPELAARGVAWVGAESRTDNLASARVLEKAGFSRAGRRQDAEDGPLVLWRRDLAPAPGPAGAG